MTSDGGPSHLDGRSTEEATDDGSPGRRLLDLDTWATVAFVAAAGAAAVFPDPLARPVAVFDGLLFLVGCGAFLAAYGRAIGRSRTDELSVAGVFFLAGGAAPAEVRRHFMRLLAVQVAIAVVTASLRPYTPLAFGVLVPVLGLGLAGLWGARHGTFPPRARRGA